VPKLVTTIEQGYTRSQLMSDVVAGVIVGVVALPLSLAFAIASGVAPSRGIATAIVGGLIVAVAGGSRVQIAGPTGAFVVIVYGVVQKYGVDGLLVATLLAGVMMVVLGLAKLGGAIKFVPQPVVTGFTSGIAVIIASSQVKDALGLRMGAVPADFIDKWPAFARVIGTTSWSALALTAATVAILVFWPRVSRRVPSPFVALVVTTLAVPLLHLPVDTIGTRFGAIDLRLPMPVLPHVDTAMLRTLLGPALTIALLGSIESLLSAVVADGMIGGRHRSNMELVAQGFANIASPFFGGLPATGAIARTATNVKNGGRTPIAGIVHALTVVAIAYGFGQYAAMVPLATLAGILLIVAYGMSEWRSFLAGLKAPRSDAAVLLVTFSLTVLVDLTIALEVGMVLAAFLFMRRMADVTTVRAASRDAGEDDDDGDVASDAARYAARREVPSDVEVFDISGPFFFGAAEKFKEALGQVAQKPRAIILRMDGVPVIDATGIHLLRDLAERARHDGTVLLLADVAVQPRQALGRASVGLELELSWGECVLRVQQT
jgi:SulP family sulfate permease